jgi:hypothetical protein
VFLAQRTGGQWKYLSREDLEIPPVETVSRRTSLQPQ